MPPTSSTSTSSSAALVKVPFWVDTAGVVVEEIGCVGVVGVLVVQGDYGLLLLVGG